MIVKKVLFISSTGGHLTELMKFEPIFKNYNYYIITERDISTEYLNNKYKNRVRFLPYCTRSKFFRYIFIYSYVILKSIYLFFLIKPDIIVSTGTHTTVPMCYLSKIFNKKVIYIETYANKTKKTLTGRIIYPIADLFIVQWNEMKKLYPKAICVDEKV